MSQIWKRAALEAPPSDMMIKRPKPSGKRTQAREIFVVSSRLSIVDLFPQYLERAPGIRVYQHWALEVGGRYYEVHRAEWKECRVSTDDTVSGSTRIIVHRKLLGYTHDDDDVLRKKARILGAEFTLYHPIWSNCQTFVLRFRNMIECDCHDRIPMPPQSAEDVADVIKLGAIFIPAAFSLLAYRWGYPINPAVQIMATGYAAWHERQARKARERQLRSDNCWRTRLLPSNECGSGDIPMIKAANQSPGVEALQVLLLYWDEDAAIVGTELESLRNGFVDGYSYNVDSWAIPSERPFRSLNRRLLQFMENDDPKDFFIVYYCGYVTQCWQGEEESIWTSIRDHAGPSIPSRAIQDILADSQSDVLQIIDSCYTC